MQFKKKRLLAAILAFIMAFSSITFPASTAFASTGYPILEQFSNEHILVTSHTSRDQQALVGETVNLINFDVSLAVDSEYALLSHWVIMHGIDIVNSGTFKTMQIPQESHPYIREDVDTPPVGNDPPTVDRGTDADNSTDYGANETNESPEDEVNDNEEIVYVNINTNLLSNIVHNIPNVQLEDAGSYLLTIFYTFDDVEHELHVGPFMLDVQEVVVDIEITDKFIDPNFLIAVLDMLGRELGDSIYLIDVARIETLDISSREIENLAGLEYFLTLSTLFAAGNYLTQLDITNNNLLWLDVRGNDIETVYNVLGWQEAELTPESNFLFDPQRGATPSIFPQISGYAGDNITWALDLDTGLLTISGWGEMWDKDEYELAPWQYYADYIRIVYVQPGITHIGTRVFANLPNLLLANVSDSVTSVGTYAYHNTPRLVGINIFTVDITAFSESVSMFNESLNRPVIGNPANSLLMGFNLTDGNEFKRGTLRPNIFLGADSDHLEVLNLLNLTMRQSDSRAFFESHTARSFEEMMRLTTNNSEVTAGGDISANIPVKKFIISTSARYTNTTQRSGSESYRHAYENFFYMAQFQQNVGVNSIGRSIFAGTNQSLLWNTIDKYSRERILHAPPSQVFAEFGSHLVTRYTYGGVVEQYMSISRVTEGGETSIASRVRHEGGGRIGIPGLFSVGGEGASDTQNSMQTDFTADNYRIHSTGRVAGGWQGQGALIAGGIDSSVWAGIDNWREGITSANAEILIDSNLEMAGIWELIPARYANRRVELEVYFLNRLSREQRLFFDEFIFSVARPRIVELPRPENYAAATIISTSADMWRIASNPNGNFIIANNIDMDSIPDWTPVHFTGRIEGNGNTIRNINLSFTNQNAGHGLFSNAPQNVRYLREITSQGNTQIHGVHVDGMFIPRVLEPTVYVLTDLPDNDRLLGNGEVIEVNLTNRANGNLGQTVNVDSNVQMVILRGGNRTFEGLTLNVEGGNTTIVLHDINLNNSQIRFLSSVGWPTLISNGTANRVSRTEGDAPVIHAAGNLHITGTADLAVAHSGVGYNRHAIDAIGTMRISLTNAQLYARAGHGAAGTQHEQATQPHSGRATNGRDGSPGESRNSYAPDGRRGTRGFDGDQGLDGDAGNNGQNGGNALSGNRIEIISNVTLRLFGGDGGSGGPGQNGAQGQDGGLGGNGGDGRAFAGHGGNAGAGGHGGRGGSGGQGGRGGGGGSPFAVPGANYFVSEFARIELQAGLGGAGGTGGNAGLGGTGGSSGRPGSPSWRPFTPYSWGSTNRGGDAGRSGDAGHGGDAGTHGSSPLFNIQDIRNPVYGPSGGQGSPGRIAYVMLNFGNEHVQSGGILGMPNRQSANVSGVSTSGGVASRLLIPGIIISVAIIGGLAPGEPVGSRGSTSEFDFPSVPGSPREQTRVSGIIIPKSQLFFEQRRLEVISVTNRQYFAGDTLITTDFDFRMHNPSNNSIVTVNRSNLNFSYDFSSAGQHIVTVTYRDGSPNPHVRYIPVVVNEPEIVATLFNPPAANSLGVTRIFAGTVSPINPFVPSGFTISAFYNNGATRVINDGQFTWNVPSDINEVGLHTITVNHPMLDGPATYIVHTVLNSVQHIEIVNRPSQFTGLRQIFQFDLFRPENLTIRVTYAGGNQAVYTHEVAAYFVGHGLSDGVTPTLLAELEELRQRNGWAHMPGYYGRFRSDEYLAPNRYPIVVTIGDISTTLFTEHPRLVTPDPIDRIQVLDGVPTEFFVGDVFPVEQMRVRSITEGLMRTRTIPMHELEINPSGPLQSFDEFVRVNVHCTVSGQRHFVDHRINVRTVEAVGVDRGRNCQVNTEYIEGQTFDATGLVIERTYNNGNIVVVTDFTVQAPSRLTPSDNVVRVFVDGFPPIQIALTVTSEAIERLEIVTPPMTTIYEQGEYFSPDGMIVRAIFNTERVVENFDGFTIEPARALRIDDTQVILRYGAAWTSQNIQVTYIPTLNMANAFPEPGMIEHGDYVLLFTDIADAVIHFTVDGTIPTRSSPVFDAENPIVITTATTIKALVIASGWRDSQVITFEYTLIPRDTRISVIHNNFTFPTAVLGYSDITPHGIIIRNDGDQDTGQLTISIWDWDVADDEIYTTSSDFMLSSATIANIPAGGQAVIDVWPVNGLGSGSHSAVVLIDGANLAPAWVGVNFNVVHAEDAQITVATATGSPGQLVTIDIRIDNNPGFATMPLRLDFSPALTLVEYNLGNSEMSQGFTGPQNTAPGQPINPPIENGFYMNWFRTNNITTDGILLSLTFAVCSDADYGFHPVMFSFRDALGYILPTDNNGIELSIEVESGGLQINPDFILGDIFGRGRVELMGATIIARFLAGHDLTEIEAAHPDFNIDRGRVTATSAATQRVRLIDATTISRFLADHDMSDNPEVLLVRD